MWAVKDKARCYIVKDINGKCEAVFNCPGGGVVTAFTCKSCGAYYGCRAVCEAEKALRCAVAKGWQA